MDSMESDQQNLTTPLQHETENQNQEDLQEIARICQSKCFYQILAITKASSPADIRRAYKKLALRFHPEKCHIQGTVEAFQKISDAYIALGGLGQPVQSVPSSSSSNNPSGHNTTSNMTPNELFNAVFIGYSDESKMNIRELITTNYKRLVSKLDGESLCPLLVQKRLISIDAATNYEKEVPLAKIKYLLDVLRRNIKNKTKLLLFMEVLLDTRQDHLILEDIGEESKDDELFDCMIKWNHDLDLGSMCDRLRQDNILTHGECNILKGLPTKPEQIKYLKEILRCGPVELFQKFKEVLESELMSVGSILPPEAHRRCYPWKKCLCMLTTFAVVAVGIVISFAASQFEEETAIYEPDRVVLPTVTNQLKSFYQSNIQMVPLIPWQSDQSHGRMDHLFTQLILVRKEFHGGERKRLPLQDHTDILKPIPGETKVPKMVHIIGEAGMGKTTLVNKLALEWTEQHEGSKDASLRRVPFRAVFVIKLRAVENDQSLEDIIIHQLGLEQKDQDLGDFLREGDCLLILDGHDEYRDQNSDINRLINGSFPSLGTNTVVITARPSRIPPQQTMPKYIEVGGFTEDMQKKYMEQYFVKDPKRAETLHRDIHLNSLEHLARVPILLQMMCSLFKHNGIIPKTQTALYTDMTRFLYDIYYEKVGHPPELTLEQLLNKTGAQAWSNLQSGNLEFMVHREEVHINLALKIGFLQVVLEPTHRTRLSRKGQMFACVLHKSVQEFLAAWHMTMTDHCYKLIHYCTNIETILEMGEVLKFMSGLAREQDLNDNISQTPVCVTEALKDLDTVAAREVRNTGNSVNQTFIRKNDLVWTLLVECYHLQGQAALVNERVLSTNTQGLTKVFMLFSLSNETIWIQERKFVTSDHNRPSPIFMGLEGVQEDFLYVKGDLMANRFTLHRGSWAGNMLAELDISRLAVVYLTRVTLNTEALKVLLDAPIRVMCLFNVTVVDDIDLNQQQTPSQHESTYDTSQLPMLQKQMQAHEHPYCHVFVRYGELNQGPGALLAEAITRAPNLQWLHISDMDFGERSAGIWDTAPVPKKLTHLHFLNVTPTQVLQWAQTSPVLKPDSGNNREYYQSDDMTDIDDAPLPKELWSPIEE